MRHPECRQKILAELKCKFPENGPSLPLEFDSLQPHVLPYTNAVFDESLRLYPPVPIEIKECTSSTTFPDGTFLPKGALVMWVPWSMGRSRRIWGEDADEFHPERWLAQGKMSALLDDIHADTGTDGSDGVKLVSRTAFEFPVFNGGARSCLGKKMAEMLAIGVITSLLWQFEFEEVSDVENNGTRCERHPRNSLTLPMDGGLPCFVKIRNYESEKKKLLNVND